MLPLDSIYISPWQAGQDAWVNDHFDRKRGLTFIEVGAADGITFSNTYFLEKCLGWNGLVIEPDPQSFQKLELVNRSCHKYQGAVLNIDAQQAPMTSCGELSIMDASTESRKESMKRAAAAEGLTASRVRVPVARLGKLLELYNMTEVHYLSIDVEGTEINVLKSIDLRKINVHVRWL